MSLEQARLYLWARRTLYIGSIPEPVSLNQAAPTLLLSFDATFICDVPSTNQTFETKSLLVPAGEKINLDIKGSRAVNCNLDPMYEDYAQLAPRFKNSIDGFYYDIEDYAHFSAVLRELGSKPLSSSDAYTKLDTLIGEPLTIVVNTAKHEGIRKPVADPRIRHVIEMIQSNINFNLTVEELAEAVGLSTARLMQLFKATTGIPIRRYRQWHRLYCAGVLLGTGSNLTDAALQAGFTDSAHFSNTFKDIMGMSPTSIFMQPGGIKIIPPEAEGIKTA